MKARYILYCLTTVAGIALFAQDGDTYGALLLASFTMVLVLTLLVSLLMMVFSAVTALFGNIAHDARVSVRVHSGTSAARQS